MRNGMQADMGEQKLPTPRSKVPTSPDTKIRNLLYTIAL